MKHADHHQRLTMRHDSPPSVDKDFFETSAKAFQIHNCEPFYKSKLFKQNNFRIAKDDRGFLVIEWFRR